ncbi:MAG: AbrB/MazE/SpoVT family DNA-binding domain-containing protein [Desulfobacterales bacterium]|jgi:bifunctional DNA-binding transcriptional regulator/antitoxin component of YhaV-PrlF toxin-antitoxin module
MMAKLTSKNQITIPKKIIEQLGATRYFQVELQEGVILLKPLKTFDTDLVKIRSKIKKLGLTPDSVGEAVKWARSKPSRS